MARDKEKFGEFQGDNNPETRAMSWVGIEKDGKDVIEVAEYKGKKQYATKDIMSDQLVEGVEFKTIEGLEAERGKSKTTDEDRG